MIDIKTIIGIIISIIAIVYAVIYYLKHRQNGRYITISKSSGYLELLQVAAYDGDGNLLKPVNITGSDAIEGSDKAPVESVIDKDLLKEQTFLTGSASTGAPESRFVTIDFGKIVNIYKIVVYLKKCCYRNIMAGTIVTVKDVAGTPVFTSYPFPEVGNPSRTDTPERTKNFFEQENDAIPYQIFTITTLPYTRLPIGK